MKYQCKLYGLMAETQSTASIVLVRYFKDKRYLKFHTGRHSWNFAEIKLASLPSFTHKNLWLVQHASLGYKQDWHSVIWLRIPSTIHFCGMTAYEATALYWRDVTVQWSTEVYQIIQSESTEGYKTAVFSKAVHTLTAQSFRYSNYYNTWVYLTGPVSFSGLTGTESAAG